MKTPYKERNNSSVPPWDHSSRTFTEERGCSGSNVEVTVELLDWETEGSITAMGAEVCP